METAEVRPGSPPVEATVSEQVYPYTHRCKDKPGTDCEAVDEVSCNAEPPLPSVIKAQIESQNLRDRSPLSKEFPARRQQSGVCL